MARINIEVTMKSIYSFSKPAYGGYHDETRYIYTMEDANGKQYVWKTTAYMGYEVADEHGWITRENGTFRFDAINRGDVVKIAATVKGESEYKGTPQTELTRVRVIERTFRAKTWEEIQEERQTEKEAKKREQLESIGENDFVWTMPYKQYKEHYADCETVIDSFKKSVRHPATISVIIREGRLKASGVRGEHYRGYEFTFEENGKECRITYRAVKEENAIRRLQKEFPDATNIQPGKIYRYV